MVHQRSIAAGMTDYTAVPLGDILTHLEDWEVSTASAMEALSAALANVRGRAAAFESSSDVAAYINYFLDLFGRYKDEIGRLRRELPEAVRDAHAESALQLYRSARLEEQVAVDFKNDWINKSLPDESVRRVLDVIYRETRGVLVDMHDFSNLVPRLRALRHDGGEREALGDLELKPNVFGMGVNLNRILGRVRNWWRGRSTRPRA